MRMARYIRRMHVVPRMFEFLGKLIGEDRCSTTFNEVHFTLPKTNQIFFYDPYYVLESV